MYGALTSSFFLLVPCSNLSIHLRPIPLDPSSPRNGDDVSLLGLICALQECYGLTWPLAAFLAIGGYVLLRW